MTPNELEPSDDKPIDESTPLDEASSNDNSSVPLEHANISQNIEGNRNVSIGQSQNSTIVSVNGGQAIFQLTSTGQAISVQEPEADSALGSNPYKGLLPFGENEGEFFVGRSKAIEALRHQFQYLYEQPSSTRLLPIYGPSGSGKSSLARAGLIPALSKFPLPGTNGTRIAVMQPGDDPLYALALVLARITTGDPNPTHKAGEYKQVLAQDDDSNFDGLQRIAYGFSEIETFPLIVVVDQFEEIYAYEPRGHNLDEQKKRHKFIRERDIFVKNLLYAASSVSKYVSVILTVRSDFLGETSKHPSLNRLFASPSGFLVTMMDEESLQEVISIPAKRAGYIMDEATVQLLIEQTIERDGALPLLQVTLTQIWTGLSAGKTPAQTIKAIGGVGGALAREAERVYSSLSPSEQEITRRLFLSLVQLGEGVQDTRRRISPLEAISSQDSYEDLEKVIQRFSGADSRLITLSGKDKEQLVEISHEALIHHWPLLHSMLEEGRGVIHAQRRIELLAEEWDRRGRQSDVLLQGKSLTRALESQKEHEWSLISKRAEDFLAASKRQLWRNQTRLLWLLIPFFLIGIMYDYYRREEVVMQYRQNLSSPNSSEQYGAILELTRGCNRIGQWNKASKFSIGERLYGNCRSLEGEAGLQKADFSGRGEFRGFYMAGASLEGANFESSLMTSINLDSAKLARVNFERANLENSIFNNADLEGANLKSSSLLYAQFISANLKSSNLSYSNLSDADFRGADLSESDLKSANLANANLTDANLSTALGLEVEQLQQGDDSPVICDTILPEHISISSTRDCR